MRIEKRGICNLELLENLSAYRATSAVSRGAHGRADIVRVVVRVNLISIDEGCTVLLHKVHISGACSS